MMRALTTQESPDFSHGECQIRGLALGMDGLTPYDKVIHAPDAAEQFSDGVSRPFNILKLGPGTALNG